MSHPQVGPRPPERAPTKTSSHVELDDPETGLDEVSYAKCEDIKSISDQRLVTQLGRTPQPAMFEVEQILRFLLRL